jgi:hypothetical protein
MYSKEVVENDSDSDSGSDDDSDDGNSDVSDPREALPSMLDIDE